jgi:hypothetical protein
MGVRLVAELEISPDGQWDLCTNGQMEGQL